MEKEQGYKKRVVTLWVETTLGDHWKDTEYCNFTEVKGIDGYVVEKKES
jgi:hypothetical protein